MASKFASLALIASAIFSTSAIPILEQRQSPGSPYECDANYNAAAHKQTLESQGATPTDLAITILETSCHMSGTSYVLGDTYPGGVPKTGDAANFGLFKNNWMSIRSHCSDFQGLQPSDWQKGEVLNTNDAMAIKCQHEQMQALGITEFYATQRGEGDGSDYATAIEYIQGYLAPAHLTDDMVTYYNLVNI